jgi:hypothetical protein
VRAVPGKRHETMELIDEHVKPVAQRFTRLRWLGVSIVLGFFLGFVDTLLIAALLGAVNIQVPAYVGVPTTFTGYFFTGLALGNMAPRTIEWEIPSGVLVCSLFLMLGLFGFKGHGFLSSMLHFIIIPAVAVGVCYFGVVVARRPAKNVTDAPQVNPEL